MAAFAEVAPVVVLVAAAVDATAAAASAAATFCRTVPGKTPLCPCSTSRTWRSRARCREKRCRGQTTSKQTNAYTFKHKRDLLHRFLFLCFSATPSGAFVFLSSFSKRKRCSNVH